MKNYQSRRSDCQKFPIKPACFVAQQMLLNLVGNFPANFL